MLQSSTINNIVTEATLPKSPTIEPIAVAAFIARSGIVFDYIVRKEEELPKLAKRIHSSVDAVKCKIMFHCYGSESLEGFLETFHQVRTCIAKEQYAKAALNVVEDLQSNSSSSLSPAEKIKLQISKGILKLASANDMAVDYAIELIAPIHTKVNFKNSDNYSFEETGVKSREVAEKVFLLGDINRRISPPVVAQNFEFVSLPVKEIEQSFAKLQDVLESDPEQLKRLLSQIHYFHPSIEKYSLDGEVTDWLRNGIVNRCLNSKSKLGNEEFITYKRDEFSGFRETLISIRDFLKNEAPNSGLCEDFSRLVSATALPVPQSQMEIFKILNAENLQHRVIDYSQKDLNQPSYKYGAIGITYDGDALSISAFDKIGEVLPSGASSVTNSAGTVDEAKVANNRVIMLRLKEEQISNQTFLEIDQFVEARGLDRIPRDIVELWVASRKSN